MRHLFRTMTLALATVAGVSSAGAGTELSVVGTGDGTELLRALGATYTAENPQTLIIVPPSIGSGGGIAAVGSGKEMLARIARPLSDSEKGLGLVEEPIFRLPSVFYVHPSAGVSDLRADQIAAIYSGTVTNWREIGGADRRIKVVRREEADSTLLVFRGSMPGWRELKLTDRSKLAMTTQEAYDTVREVEGAIGFGPYTKAIEDDLVVLSVDGHRPTDPGYPSAVVVAFAYKPDTVTKEARAFVEFAKSKKARSVLQSMGGVPVPN